MSFDGRIGWRLDALRLLVAATAVFGLPLVFLAPPFASPDEPAHFYRAWAISEGRFVAQTANGQQGATVPRGLRDLQVLATVDGSRPGAGALTLDRLAAARAIALAPGERLFVDFRNTLQTPALLYLPQAAACLAARLIGLGPLAALYLARIANLAAATALLGWAVRRLPEPRWWLVAVALSPMALALRASLSADALGFAIAVAFLAEVAALAVADRALSAGELGLLIALAAALGGGKPVYAPLVLLLFLVPALGGWRGGLRGALPALLACLFAMAIHAATLAATRLRWDAEVDASAQLARLAHAPLAVALTLVADLVRHAPRFLAQAFGHRLGWQDAPLPLVVELLVLTGVALLLWTEERGAFRWRRGDRWLLALSTLAVALCVELALWIQWTPPAHPGVEGVQGRYFLPLALPLAWWLRSFGGQRSAPGATPGPAAPGRNWAPALATAVAMVSGCGTWIAMLTAYRP